jgi:hypothetical protein
MTANNQIAERREVQDDMQHINVQRTMALAVISRPQSRVGSIISERLAELYNRLGEAIDPAKRAELKFAANVDRLAEKFQSPDQNNTPSMGGVAGAAGMLSNSQPGTALDLGARLQDRTQVVDPVTRETQIPKIKEFTSPATRQDPAVQQAQMQWVWMLSQLLQTDLKRLGLEPDELNDIRILLIKKEAGEFDKLKLLSQLPDSLSPDAQAKIFEDIRTMAAGYVAVVMIERAKSEIAQGGEVSPIYEIPRSIGNAFYAIPPIDFEPEDILKKLD